MQAFLAAIPFGHNLNRQPNALEMLQHQHHLPNGAILQSWGPPWDTGTFISFPQCKTRLSASAGTRPSGSTSEDPIWEGGQNMACIHTIHPASFLAWYGHSYPLRAPLHPSLPFPCSVNAQWGIQLLWHTLEIALKWVRQHWSGQEASSRAEVQ